MYLSTCRSFALCMIVMLIAQPILAQVKNTDSLRSALEATDDAQSRAKILFRLAEKVENEDPEKALTYYNEVVTIAKSIHDQYLLSDSYNRIGTMWFYHNDIQRSTEYYFRALDGLDYSSKNALLIGKLNNNIGWNFQKKGDYARALNYFEKSLEILETGSDKNTLALLYNNLGVTYKQLNRIDEALNMYKLSLRINRETGNIDQQLYNINNIGVIYLTTGQYELAIEYFKEALNLNYQRNNLSEVASNLHNLGKAIRAVGDNKQAKDTLLHAMEIAHTMNKPDLVYELLFELYEVSMEEQEFENALGYFVEHRKMEDSLSKKDQYTSLVELEARYKVSQNERAMQLSQSQLLNQRLINAVILSVLVLALFLIAFLIWVYMMKKKNEKVLISLNKEIDAKNEKIQAINRNLEQTVKQRTKTIQDQNVRLMDYAHMNSHRVRRPLSSILGLVNLLQDETDMTKRRELIDLIEAAARELDDIIFDINQKLHEEKI